MREFVLVFERWVSFSSTLFAQRTRECVFTVTRRFIGVAEIKHILAIIGEAASDAEKKAEWIIKSLLKYDLEVFKIPIDEEDVSEMGVEEFKNRLLSSRQIKNEMYFFEQMLENI